MKRKKERRSRIRTPLDFPTASGRKSRASGDRAARGRNDRENNLRSREGEKRGIGRSPIPFFGFLSPFSERAPPARPTKNGCVCGLRRLCRLVSAETGFLLIASALICPAAIASRLPLPKSVFPFLPPALLSCRDCFFPFRADCLHSCIVSAEKRFYLSFKQPAPAAKAAGAGCLRSISAKIRRKTDGFPCRGASFVCAAWERNALSPPAFSLGPNARTAPHALSRRARLWPCPSVPALRSNRRRSLAFCPSRPPLEHSAIPARAFCAGGDCGSQQTRAGGGRVREKCVVRGKAKCKTKRSGAGNLPRSALSAEKRLIRRAFSILRERSPQAPPRRRARPLRQRPGCTPSALPGWGNRCCCSREVARRR